VAIRSAETPWGAIDPGSDDHVLLAGADRRGGERDRLLARAAEPVEGRAGHRDWPAGRQHREAGDVRTVVALHDPVAGDDVLDLGRIDARPIGERDEHLAEQLLRVDAVQRARRLAPAAGGAQPVDDEYVACGHGSLQCRAFA
jgi:hypothetical protein